MGYGEVMKRGTWSQLGKDKLGSSGLTTTIADQLGMYEVPSAMQLNQNFEARAALVIPYFDLARKPAKARPGLPDFYRIRYLEKGKDFKAAAGEDQRYSQPAGTGVCAYFPTLEDWGALAKDTTAPLIITEGELKAAAATLAGFPTIGLGGVWNFRRANEGVFFLPELEKINWKQRETFICFDSDYTTKPQVCGAINRLCDELFERGALVKVLLLPALDEHNKTGLDDYFLEKSNAEFEALLDEAQDIGMCKPLWKINDEVLYVQDPGLIIVQETGQKMSPSQFKEHSHWATESTPEVKITADGDVRVSKVPAAPVWIKWPLRRTALRMTYAPGQPKITERNEYNGWKGWGCEPKKGNIDPWLKLTQFVFRDMEKKELEYFYDWCAYPIQNPGVKMFVAVVVHGVTQGTGKSLIGYSLGEVYGENFKEIKDDDLEETFWAENKQFVMGDEVTGNDNRKHSSTLKRLISQRSININIKFVPQYDVPDRINYYFTAQHADSFFLEDRDRRFFIVECAADEPLPESFFRLYDDWLWRGEGPSALHHWLLERKISKDFNPHAPAMRTDAKDRMIITTKGDLGLWINNLLKYPNEVLKLGRMKYTRDLFTSKELLAMYENEHPNSKVTVGGLGRALANAGCPQMANGQPLPGPDGRMERYFAVRNIPVWRTVKDRKKLIQHIAIQPTRGENDRKP